MLNTPYTRLIGDRLHGTTPELTPAWVRLDAICVPRSGVPSVAVADGLLMSGTVPGFVHGWFRASTGEWLGVVNYEVRYADGRRESVWLTDQLVPGYALAPRDDGRDATQ
ncbi:hypothetical protein SAMN05192558_109310 [Actinokineospora alba]|uniref:Uncharacterized protein n=1 Tax=Actinokineospora alba TaxID=504798 RepID=A0A1H0T845_9PSEU|nr:hypothetical protein [Actinokineospora alba]TDP66330.1 hypothetical protein C8E96_1831 [Actinokineospora alba]SDJ22105.1 hypothetical protein SAMN05421871_11165 [Actinokineospora alba]SDP49981.1 hypothetical protein SAMN05192558_109310 [Actinokineospora alba]